MRAFAPLGAMESLLHSMGKLPRSPIEGVLTTPPCGYGWPAISSGSRAVDDAPVITFLSLNGRRDVVLFAAAKTQGTTTAWAICGHGWRHPTRVPLKYVTEALESTAPFPDFVWSR